ncbi:DNA polymerase [Candidatus Bathyarchaeota archaeon ex4484_135]|nr:MAG: DNA polymerase [Candidatus Bathyarchaeota archaeon ex4484_135]
MPEECRFWLLDLNYEVINHEPEVWLWGITDGGKRVLLIDKGYLPYFYAVLEEGADPEAVLERVRGLVKADPLMRSAELVERKYFGRPVRAIKVVCQDPEQLEKQAKKVAKVEGVKECLEDDIRYSMSYLIDKGLRPCGWHSAKVRPLEQERFKDVQVDAVYEVVEGPVTIEEHVPPELRLMAFYMLAYSPKGSPRPEKNPVVVISVMTGDGDLRTFVAKEGDDRPIIRAFCDFIRSYDPDVIFGFRSNDKAWPYLAERAKVLGLELPVGRTGVGPHTSVYGHVSITGRANVDLYDFAEKDLPAVKVKTLENVADYLGVMPLEGREVLDPPDVKFYWEDKSKKPRLVKFCEDNARCIMGIGRSVLEFALQLSNLTGIPLDHVLTAAVGFRVEWLLIREARKRGELVPKRAERKYRPYVGGMVLKPRPGIHEKIAVLDYKSLYPSIMIKENLSPDTYLRPEEPEPPEGVNVAPEVGHKFRREPPGLYREVLSALISARDEIRERLRELEPGTALYRLLDARQKALKVVANATYGYAGWLGARWYLRPVAESTAAWGRYVISKTIEMAKEMGIELIYGDTDSVFVRYEPEKVEKFLKAVEEEFGLKIKPDEIFERVLFTEAKKRYCGLLPDGRLEIVGLEAVRGDWSAVARKVQKEVLEAVLKARSPQEGREKAVKIVRDYIRKLKAKEVPYKDLVIWEELTRRPEEYKVRTAHVEAAKIMMRSGWDISVGDKVGYVVVRGSGKLYERAMPYFLATYDDLDLDYYVKKQIVPAAMRVLKVLGVKEEELLAGVERKGLMAFFS